MREERSWSFRFSAQIAISDSTAVSGSTAFSFVFFVSIGGSTELFRLRIQSRVER
jgi:hypothetical protein